MPLSIESLNLPKKIAKYILEGDEVVPFDAQETEVIFALVNMNHAESTIREIWDAHRVGARMRRHGAKGGCYDGCKCKAPVSGADEYFRALYSSTVAAAEENARSEIASMESQLGITIEKITIYESTETSFKVQTSAGTFMMDPEKMWIPNDFAKTVFAKIQKVISITNKKLWPVLVSYWMKTKSERVRVISQTNTGIVDTALKEFMALNAVECTQETTAWEIEKGNVAVVPKGDEEGQFYIILRINDFMDHLERSKVKIPKNMIISSLQDMGWNQKRIGRSNLRVWSILTKENPLLSSPASPEAARLPGESVALPSL